MTYLTLHLGRCKVQNLTEIAYHIFDLDKMFIGKQFVEIAPQIK